MVMRRRQLKLKIDNGNSNNMTMEIRRKADGYLEIDGTVKVWGGRQMEKFK